MSVPHAGEPEYLKMTPARRVLVDDFVSRLVNMHAEAHQLRLHVTGQELHKAVQAVGYEIIEQMERGVSAADLARLR